MADQAQTQTGASQEQFLLDLLVSQNQELLNTATQTGGFNGTATLQQTGRSLTLDTLAILQQQFQIQNEFTPFQPIKAPQRGLI